MTDNKNNTGDRNSGYWNSGYRNSGDWNSGYGNSGYWNSGYGNSCDRSSGIFCNQAPKVYLFNEPTDLKWEDIDHPCFADFKLTKWIPESEMTDQEKEDNSTFHTTGGYLKAYGYKDTWVNFWRDTDQKNRDKVLNLPNFNAEIFKDITGIDVENKADCSGKIVEIDGKKYRLVEAE